MISVEKVDKKSNSEVRGWCGVARKCGGVRALGVFTAGILVLLPLGGTLLILGLLVSVAYDWVGPSSKLGSLLVGIGIGGGNEVFRYLLGLAIVLALIFVIGLLAEFGMRKGIEDVSDRLMSRIPVVKTVYDTLSNFISLLSKKEQGSKGGMSPVWCRFGEGREVVMLGLLSCPEKLKIGGKPFFAVVVPTAPVPVGGGLLFMETDRVEIAEGIGIEALTSIYVSMGVTSPQFIKTASQNS